MHLACAVMPTVSVHNRLLPYCDTLLSMTVSLTRECVVSTSPHDSMLMSYLLQISDCVHNRSYSCYHTYALSTLIGLQ
jgi:hypothetical protein